MANFLKNEMRHFNLYKNLSFLFSFCVTCAFAGEISSSHFTITYSEKDTMFARIAHEHLQKKQIEISHDFNLSTADFFQVVIVPSRKEFREYLQGQLPSWTGAFASPHIKTMIIRSPRWSNEFLEFKVVLTHELLHLMMPDIVGSQSVPRWINEGMAIFYSGEERWKTSAALSKALATNSQIPLRDIDRVLSFHRIQAELAYHESYSAIHYILSTYDLDGLKAILYGIRDRIPIDEIFIQATGSRFNDFEKEWLEQAKKTHRWYWLSEFESYIWIIILVLVILAVLVRKIRNRKIIADWDNQPEEDIN